MGRRKQVRVRPSTPERRAKTAENWRKWAALNPDKASAARARSSKAYEVRKYGISYEDYCELLLLQGFRCAICGKHNDDLSQPNKLCIDHDHETGTVRALLCGNCNVGIGRLMDSEALLLRAAEYLREHATVRPEMPVVRLDCGDSGAGRGAPAMPKVSRPN